MVAVAARAPAPGAALPLPHTRRTTAELTTAVGLGGEVIWAVATTPDGKRYSHYFNLLPDGTRLDLTREQFPDPTELLPPTGKAKTAGADGSSFATTRAYVLSFQATLRRYEALRGRVRVYLGEGLVS